MLALAIPLGFLAIGIFCWLMFTAAIYALPCFVAISVFLHVQQGGAGPLGAILLGFLAGAFVLVIGQTVLSRARNPSLRVTVALMFAIPAAVAGYSTMLGLSNLLVPSTGFQHAFAILGALAVGVAACLRLAASPAAIALEAHHAPEQPNPREAGGQTVLPHRRPLRISSRAGVRNIRA